MNIRQNWNTIPPIEASQILFHTCVSILLSEETWRLTTDITIKLLTQRLYGDYRQIMNTPEYKRAEKHVKYFKNTGIGRYLF